MVNEAAMPAQVPRRPPSPAAMPAIGPTELPDGSDQQASSFEDLSHLRASA